MRYCKFGATSDVEKAFLKLIIRIQDRDALRFFFPNDIFDPQSPMKIYRYRVVIFGASCSPFLLAAVIQRHLEIMLGQDDELAKRIIEGLYVDNLLTAMNNEQELLEYFHKTRSIFEEANLWLRQWASNSKELMNIATKEKVHDDSQKVKVLGMKWNTELDRLEFNKKIKTKDKFTKRAVLEMANSIYDPLGMLVPVEINCRMFLQKL